MSFQSQYILNEVDACGTERQAVPHLEYRPDLQGLRAVAILLVVLAHSGLPWLAGGFVGVDVFFVLSGYLITGLLLQEFDQTGRIDLPRFYARRLKRLLPALTVMLAVTIGLAYLLLSPFEIGGQLASAPYAATWTSNLHFAFAARDYFDELSARDLFLHSWSLGVEEQFYLLWPLLLLCSMLIGPAGRFAQGQQSRLRILGGITFASLALSLYLTSRWPQGAFYLMPSRVWQFSLGAMIYVAFTPSLVVSKPFTSHFRLKPRAASLALAVGLMLIIGSAVFLETGLAYPGAWALLPSSGAVLLIAAGQGLLSGRRVPLAHFSLVWLGDRSYSWYLWHWPILILGFSLGFEGQVLPVVGLIVISLFAAMFSYKFVELPFWKGGLSQTSFSRVVLVSCLVMSVAFAVSFHGLRSLPNSDGAFDATAQWRQDLPEIYAMGCDATHHHARLNPCVFGDERAEKTVVLLGDSIGAQWFSMVPAIFQTPEWRTIVLTKSACALVDVEYFYPLIGGMYKTCTKWRNNVLDELARDRPEVVIVGSSSTYGFKESEWIDGSKRVISRISPYAGLVLLIPGTPNLSFDGPGCVVRNMSPEGQVDRDSCVAKDRALRVAQVTKYLKQAAEPFPNVQVLDLAELVCPGGDCAAASEDGVVVFRDSQHLTDSFVRNRVPAIRERLSALIGDLK